MKDPKDTNPIGGKGKGKGGIKTYIDEIISKSESAAQRPNLRKQNSQPSFQENFGTGKEVWSPETVQKPVGDIEDIASASGEQTEENMDEYNEELHHEEQVGPEGEVKYENSFFTLGFPIGDLPRGVAPMKNIPLSALPNFHGLSSEDPNEFLFEKQPCPSFVLNAEISTHKENVHWKKIQSALSLIKIMIPKIVHIYQGSRKHYNQRTKKLKLSI